MIVKRIKTYSSGSSFESFYNEINDLIRLNLDTDTLPFLNETPSAQETNVISGKHFLDANKYKIELKAASIGTDRNLWIYGADAELLGLSLKENNPSEYLAQKAKNKNFDCEPVKVFARIKEKVANNFNNHTNVMNEGVGVHVQCAYLIEQFTEKSLNRLYSLTFLNNKLYEKAKPSVKIQSENVAKHILKNISEYDSGLSEISKRASIRKNFIQNNKADSPSHLEAKKKYQSIVSHYTPEQKILFDSYRMYYANQISGSKINIANNTKNERVKQAFLSVLNNTANDKKMSSIITRTIFDAMAFTERLSHYNFSFEPVFTAHENHTKEINRLCVSAPNAASRLKDNQIDNLLDEKTRLQMLSPSKNYSIGGR